MAVKHIAPQWQRRTFLKGAGLGVLAASGLSALQPLGPQSWAAGERTRFVSTWNAPVFRWRGCQQDVSTASAGHRPHLACHDVSTAPAGSSPTPRLPRQLVCSPRPTLRLACHARPVLRPGERPQRLLSGGCLLELTGERKVDAQHQFLLAKPFDIGS